MTITDAMVEAACHAFSRSHGYNGQYIPLGHHIRAALEAAIKEAGWYPPEGDQGSMEYRKGDTRYIMPNSTVQEVWICVESGNPGRWMLAQRHELVEQS